MKSNLESGLTSLARHIVTHNKQIVNGSIDGCLKTPVAQLHQAIRAMPGTKASLRFAT
jgi:hypothetical protein